MTYSVSRKINNWHNWGCFRQSHLQQALNWTMPPWCKLGPKSGLKSSSVYPALPNIRTIWDHLELPFDTQDMRLCIQYASDMLGSRLRWHSVRLRLLVRVILLFIWSHTWWLITWWETNYVAPQDTKESMRGRPWVRGPVGVILQRVISFCS